MSPKPIVPMYLPEGASYSSALDPTYYAPGERPVLPSPAFIAERIRRIREAQVHALLYESLRLRASRPPIRRWRPSNVPLFVPGTPSDDDDGVPGTPYDDDDDDDDQRGAYDTSGNEPRDTGTFDI